MKGARYKMFLRNKLKTFYNEIIKLRVKMRDKNSAKENFAIFTIFLVFDLKIFLLTILKWQCTLFSNIIAKDIYLIPDETKI